MSKVVELRSGAQSGADRGAMDAAQACGVRVEGWCPDCASRMDGHCCYNLLYG